MLAAMVACPAVNARRLLIACCLALSPIAGGVARADDIPELNVEPTCHGIAQQSAAPSERGGPDLGYSQCVQSEQAMRQQLVGEWSTFTAADKTNCVAEAKSAGLPSYTDLVTCLEIARDARQLNNPSPTPYRIER